MTKQADILSGICLPVPYSCLADIGSDIQQIAENLQRSVCLVGQHLFGQHFSKLPQVNLVLVFPKDSLV